MQKTMWEQSNVFRYTGSENLLPQGSFSYYKVHVQKGWVGDIITIREFDTFLGSNPMPWKTSFRYGAPGAVLTITGVFGKDILSTTDPVLRAKPSLSLFEHCCHRSGLYITFATSIVPDVSWSAFHWVDNIIISPAFAPSQRLTQWWWGSVLWHPSSLVGGSEEREVEITEKVQILAPLTVTLGTL